MTEPARRRKDEGQGAAVAAAEPGRGVTMARVFTTPGQDPYDAVEWERRSAVITGEKGEVVFEQHDVEIPEGVVAAGDQRRRVEVFPRRRSAARSARPASGS